MKDRISRNSSSEVKRSLANVVYDQLTDFFFDKVTFINLAYSDLGSGGTIETTEYDTSSRIIDSSVGLYMRPGLESRMRCSFYLKNPDYAEAYLLSPAVFDGTTLPSPLTSISSLSAYVGLKFVGRNIYLVTKESGRNEKVFDTGITMTMYDHVFTDTYVLDIKHNVRFTDIYINGTLVGSLSSDLVGTTPLPTTFYAFFAPATSTGSAVSAGSFEVDNSYEIVTVGTTDFTLIGAASNTVGVRFTSTGAGSGSGTAARLVNIVAEHIQFIQSKE